MRALRACLFVLGLFCVAGCPSSKSTDNRNPSGKDKLKISGPPEAVALLRGKTTDVEITVTRPDNFNEDLTLKVEISPPRGKKGVTAKIAPSTLKPGGDGRVTLTVTTTENAGEGEYKARITATPASASPVHEEVKLVVPRS